MLMRAARNGGRRSYRRRMTTEPRETASLWDYRRRVADIYRDVRDDSDPASAHRRWRAARDELFATHHQSPLEPDRKPGFTGLAYHPYDPGLRVEGTLLPAEPVTIRIPHSADGTTSFRRFGSVAFDIGGNRHQLSMYWLDGYGGGVFLPFRDATCGDTTYGGGRYLLDTVKGADLGAGNGSVVLDFNFAYHPSCVHSPRWSCPLAPPENRLEVRIEAGERLRSASDPGPDPTQETE